MTESKQHMADGRFWYAAAFLLTACYPHSIIIWQALSQRLDAGVIAAAPIIVTALTLFIVIFFTARHARGFSPSPRRWAFISLGVILAVTGLFATDSDFPAKRIHIPQYIFLTLIVRRALSTDLPNKGLLPATVLFACLLGVHDELLQGLHPERTFGLRDLGVNALGVLSGAALATGFFKMTRSPHPLGGPRPPATLLASAAALMLGLALMLIPLENLRDAPIPVWTIAPLIAAGLSVALLHWRSPFLQNRPFIIIVLTAVTTPLYLLISYAPIYRFH